MTLEYRAKDRQAPVIVGILLAAGRGRRVGTPKALLRLGGETFHARGLRTLRDAGMKTVVVVSETVEGSLGPLETGEHRVVNQDPDGPAGMFGSVRLGLAAAASLGASAAVLLPVDHPLVTAEDVGAIAARLAQGAAVVVASHAGKRGHPIGVSLGVMEEIVVAPLTSTLRDFVRRDAARVVEVEASEGAILGVNTRQDLERVSNRTFR